MPRTTPPKQATPRAHQLREAKQRQRVRQRAAGLVHVQLTVPRSTAEKIAVARRAGEFDHALQEMLNRSVIHVGDYPVLTELAWNRRAQFIPAKEAFQLYERNWRFVRGKDLQRSEHELIERLARDFGGGVINA